jgi:hypothetical protein
MRYALVLVFALCLSAEAAQSQAEALRPLLAFHSRTRATVGRQLLVHRDFVIAQDGRMVGRSRDNQIGGVGWVNQPPIQALAPREALEDLLQALDASRVGFLPASCWFFNDLPLTGTVELTWYGSGRRFREISVAINGEQGSASLCPAEMAPLLSEIDTFLQRVPGIASATGAANDLL